MAGVGCLQVGCSSVTEQHQSSLATAGIRQGLITILLPVLVLQYC